jgi:hypothetical protein
VEQEKGSLKMPEAPQSVSRTYDQVRNEARQRGIKGRSRMRKAQLEKILSR